MTPNHAIHQLRLIDLANDLLSPEETRETMAHIRECAECEARFRELVADREALRAGPAPLMSDGRIQLVKPGRGRPAGLRVAVAAAIVALVAVGVFRAVNRDEPLEYWIPVGEETTVLRSPNSDTQPDVLDALRAYEKRDAPASIEELRKFTPAPGDVTASTLRDLYLASALVNAGQPQEGLDTLQRLGVEWMPTQWRYYAQWVQYVGLVRAGRKEEARARLETLSHEPGKMGKRARAELERLR